nr:metal ABC transporter permease [Candidatus Sigynarchaeota archaeon]
MNFAQPFVYRPMLAAILIASTCAIIGVFVIMRRMVFMVDGIAHSSFAGGALAVLLQENVAVLILCQECSLLIIAAFGMASAIIIGIINEMGKLNNETAIGIMFAFTMALGIIFIGLIRSYTTGISALLFGSVGTIDWNEFVIVAIMSAGALGLVMAIKKELFFMSFDKELAKANGIPVRKVSYVFLILVAAIVIISIKAIGVILLLALIVTPAASAYQLTYNINKMLVFAVIIAIAGSIFGYMVAFVLEISASAMIVVFLTGTFFTSLAISPKRRYKKAILDEDTCAYCNRVLRSTKTCPYCDAEDTHEQDDHDHGIETHPGME